MITLPCTSCQKVLQIDDAFAGGVCRCQHCGTIQTVPARSKASAAPPKTLYQKHKSPTTAADGSLSSGSPARAAQPPAPPASARRNITVAIACTIVLVAAVIVIWLMMRPAA